VTSTSITLFYQYSGLLAKEADIETEETELYVYDAYAADEMFVAANSYTIMPVSMFNEKELAKPIPGPVTQQLFKAFSELVGVDIYQRPIDYAQAGTETKQK